MPPGGNENEKVAEADGILRNYMFGSFAVQAMTPLPFLDKPMQIGVQLKLVRALASHFDVPFDRTHVQVQLRELVGASSGEMAFKLLRDVVTQKNDHEKVNAEAKAFLGGLTSGGLQKATEIFLKTTIPGARLVFGYSEVLEPLALLYGIGQIFIRHFNSGGTIWTLQVAAVKETFEMEVQIGKRIVELRFGQTDS
jgi:hypothetical protein